MRIHEFKCFGARHGEGDLALVLEDDYASEAERQAFARARGITCVFIDPSPTPDAAAIVDYFYPHMRSPLCLHATLAAAQVLFARAGHEAPLIVKTAMRGQELVLERIGDEPFVRLARQDVPRVGLAPDLAARLLDAPGLVLPSPPGVASVGSPKLLIEVADVATLYALRPNLPLIAQWSAENGINGCYAYCRIADGQYEGRSFNHLDPALEDSATGVAAGALTALLGRGIDLRQGKVTGRDCLISTRVDGEAILVGGRAE
jgi:PhzF family phenazine biosynthesis protein